MNTINSVNELIDLKYRRGELDDQSSWMGQALHDFTEYFVKNYPGPDTIICDPTWHAPKLFRNALWHIEQAQKRDALTAKPAPRAGGDEAGIEYSPHGNWKIDRNTDTVYCAQDGGWCAWGTVAEYENNGKATRPAESVAQGGEVREGLASITEHLQNSYDVASQADDAPAMHFHAEAIEASYDLAQRISEVIRLLDNVTAAQDSEADYLGQAENMLRQMIEGAPTPAPAGSAQSGQSYTAETYCVVYTGETGWCVKHGDDLVCDVYAPQGEAVARRIATLLNTPPAGAREKANG